ncbi:MAG: NAD(P)-dependent oxidoreductase [Acidimicrobiales bacterium]
MFDHANPARPGVPTVAVIGTGIMGSAIARRLLREGFRVRVWNRSSEPVAALAECGATAFADPIDAVADAPVVLTLLPTGDAVAEVMVGRAVVDALAPGSVWAQMGTIGVEATERFDRQVRARRPDVAFVDAPVSGSRQPAESGQLLVLASGPDEARSAVDPVFDAIGRATLWVGPAGTGTRLKVVLNTWLAFEVEAAAEAAATAAALGIAPGVLAAAVGGNPVASPLATAKLAKMQAADDRADFPLAWALKDLDLTRDAVGFDAAPVAAAIAERWRGLVEQGSGGLDVSAARHGLDVSAARPGLADAPPPPAEVRP